LNYHGNHGVAYRSARAEEKRYGYKEIQKRKNAAIPYSANFDLGLWLPWKSSLPQKAYRRGWSRQSTSAMNGKKFNIHGHQKC
jgi:hypothetical protein